MLDELLQKAITLYVRPEHREVALVTFRTIVNAAEADGANKAISALTAAGRKAVAK